MEQGKTQAKKALKNQTRVFTISFGLDAKA